LNVDLILDAVDKKKLRNLKVDEIVGQIMLAKQRLGDFQRMTAAPHACPRHVTQAVTNLVAMGMGEPGYNWRAVKQAMRIVMDADGIGIGKRRITISTSGVVPIIAEVGDELDVNLAISLHACRNDVRDVLVPINKTYPLDLLMEGK
jgi:23S rRNA (adenine2503-C2)-methyltransferase